MTTKPSEDTLLDALNPEQRSAVTHRNGHLLVVAGPGTGKTLTLTHRMAHLLRSQDAAPEEMLALTFTRKAAREMSERFSRLLTSSTARSVQAVTFHRLCLRILRQEGQRIGLPMNFILCSEMDAKAMASDLFKNCGGDKRGLSDFMTQLPALKSHLALHHLETKFRDNHLSVCRRYQNVLRDNAMLDMDDLEIETVRLLQGHPDVAMHLGEKFRWIFVDEYQDTNANQVAILKALIHGDRGEIFAIGDADQAIYGFRGSDLRHFHQFDRDFPGAGRIVLTQNYRSTPVVLNASATLMEKPQALSTQRTEGDPINVAHLKTADEEAEMVVAHIERLMGGISHFSMNSGRVDSRQEGLSLSFGDMAVLYRLNAQGDALEKALSRRGIPYIRSGESPLITRHPADILWRFFQMARYPENPYYKTAYERLVPDVSQPPPEDGSYKLDGPVSDILEHAVALHSLQPSTEAEIRILDHLKRLAKRCKNDIALFVDTLSLERGIDHAFLDGDRVALMSLHAAKGLEWEVVFITGCEDRLLPCSLFGHHNESEERRLFYVGMTRARSRLILSHVDRRSIKGGGQTAGPSPFLDRIPPELCCPLDRGNWQRKPRPHKQLELF